MSGLSGQATDIDIHAREILRMREITNQLMAKHCSQPLEKVERDVERDFIMNAAAEPRNMASSTTSFSNISSKLPGRTPTSGKPATRRYIRRSARSKGTRSSVLVRGYYSGHWVTLVTTIFVTKPFVGLQLQ